MATKSKKKTVASKPARQWQKNVAHVVEAALEQAGGRGTTIAAIVAKTGLKESAVERHVTYMAGKLDGYPLKNVRAKINGNVVKLVGEPGSFRGESWIDDARARFVNAKAVRAARRKARAKK